MIEQPAKSSGKSGLKDTVELAAKASRSSQPSQPSIPSDKRPLFPILALVLVLVVTVGGLFVWRFVFKNTLLEKTEPQASSSPKTGSNLPADQSSVSRSQKNEELFFEGNILSLTENEINFERSSNKQNYRLKLSQNTLITKKEALSSDTTLEIPIGRNELKSGLRIEVELKPSNKEEIFKIAIL